MPMDVYSPDPRAAKFADIALRHDTESAIQHDRLKGSPVDLLERVLFDGGEPFPARANALLLLLQRRDLPRMVDTLVRLLDDPDPRLGLTAIRSFCPRDERVVDRLREMLADDRDEVWPEAACALAGVQDDRLLGLILPWMESGDEGHRNVAIACLTRLESAEARRALEEAWVDGGRDDGDRSALANAMLSRGDARGVPHLREMAARADGAGSVSAATSLWIHDPRLGLELMGLILVRGTLEARRSLVMQIWNFSRSPHAFTADGIHDARAWIDRQLESLANSDG